MDVNYQLFPGSRRVAPLPTLSSAGFTLVELLVTVLVAAILVAAAFPSFSALIQSQQLTSQVNTLVMDMNLARTEAVKRTSRILLCKSRDKLNCDFDAAWRDGWIIFPDRDADNSRDANEPVLWARAAISEGYNIHFHSYGSSNYIRYYPDGRALNNGTFTFCAPDGAERARAVIVFRTGRVHTDTVDGSGDPLTCPN